MLYLLIYSCIYTMHTITHGITQPPCMVRSKSFSEPTPSNTIRNWALATVTPKNMYFSTKKIGTTLSLSHPTFAVENFMNSGDVVGTAGIRFGNNAFI